MALALAALTACSQAKTSEEPDSSVLAVETQSGNLSQERALELVQEGQSQERRDPVVRTALFFYKRPPEVQALIDNGFAEGTSENWRLMNGAVLDSNPYSHGIHIPTHRKTLSIDGIVTEGRRAAIQYRYDYMPTEPGYNFACVINKKAVWGYVGCPEMQPTTGTIRAVRQDDGQWRRGG